MNPAFNVAREIGTNLSQSFNRVRDENQIEKILTEAQASKNPELIQQSIGKILSSVAPERQPQAIAYLQNVYSNIERKQQEKEKREAAIRGGYDPYAPPAVQAAQVKEAGKTKRASEMNKQVGLGGQPSQGAISPLQNLSDQQLEILSGSEDRTTAEQAKQILKGRQQATKEDRADIRQMSQQRQPIIADIIQRANTSEDTIRNKTRLVDLVDRGNLNDPTIATLLDNLPLNLGRRLLSDDTIEYKGALIDDYADLKNIFKGATRVKEVELYEQKLPDIYLTDSQKKAVLKSRINTAKVDLIRRDAAAELEREEPNLSALQFNKRLEEKAKPQIDALFNQIWDENKAIIDQAESRKDMKLNINDPEDKSIMQQILQEAGGNWQEAAKLARKKGYSF